MCFQRRIARVKDGERMKRVRFEEPEEFVADCSVVFDRVLSRCFENKQDRVELKDR